MKRYYSIGEAATLLGVSTKTLRYYDKEGLLKPYSLDEETGYRYYSYKQFHIVDRIKYLQGLGLPLNEIKRIITSGSVEELIPALENQRKLLFAEIKESIERLDSIQWYIDYFTFMNKGHNAEKLYKIKLDKRYAIAVDHNPGEVPIANMEVNLQKIKGLPENKNLKYLRQYAYTVDFKELVEHSDCLQKRTYWPIKYFIYLKEKPDFYTPNLIELPAGEYLCYRARILKPGWDAEILKDFFKEKALPRVVIANEFEENLVEYLDTTYELQMLLQ